MLLPYNVDRPTRLTPTITYALMAANILVYLLTTGYSNYRLQSDRADFNANYAKQLKALLPDADVGDGADSQFNDGSGAAPPAGSPSAPGAGGSSSGSSLGQAVPLAWRLSHYPSHHEQSRRESHKRTSSLASEHRSAGHKYLYSRPGPFVLAQQGGGSGGSGGGEGNGKGGADAEGGDAASAVPDDGAMRLASQLSEAQVNKLQSTPDGRVWVWNVLHQGDKLTLDTHPVVMDYLAYYVGAPSLLGIFSSMFLHANLEHLLGNMLFLWVFGRASEDTLGRGIFLGAYLVCGVAACLLYHLMAQNFTPSSINLPFMGASGAIAGVQGLFAPRFYRTPVRIMVTNFMGARILYLAAPILGYLIHSWTGMGNSSYTFATLIALAALVILGDESLWFEWKLAAAYMVAGWIVVFDLAPALFSILTGQEGGGTAHWAHIGGLLCGVLYAFIIGAHKEGKTEYLVDEARQSLDLRLAGNAIETAQQVVMMKPDDAVGYQLLAEAHDRKDNREEALKNYHIALDKYLRKGERSMAAKMYQDATVKYSEWVPDAPILFALASQMAKDEHWKGAAESLAKLPYYYPEASEGEMSFLRAAQIYIEKLGEPMVAMQLLYEFGNRFPDSQWVPKATKLYEAASQMHAGTPAS